LNRETGCGNSKVRLSSRLTNPQRAGEKTGREKYGKNIRRAAHS
jgi:hypothetical protein